MVRVGGMTYAIPLTTFGASDFGAEEAIGVCAQVGLLLQEPFVNQLKDTVDSLGSHVLDSPIAAVLAGHSGVPVPGVTGLSVTMRADPVGCLISWWSCCEGGFVDEATKVVVPVEFAGR